MAYSKMDGNKFAEKWTLDEALEFFRKSLDILKKDSSILFIGSLAVKMETYRELYAYLYNKFSDNQEVFNTIKTINTIIESRLLEAGIKGNANATIAIFTLKNNHGWTDKVETVNTNTTTATIIVDGKPLHNPVTNENDLNDLI